jgi:hypothetical protein
MVRRRVTVPCPVQLALRVELVGEVTRGHRHVIQMSARVAPARYILARIVPHEALGAWALGTAVRARKVAIRLGHCAIHPVPLHKKAEWDIVTTLSRGRGIGPWSTT